MPELGDVEGFRRLIGRLRGATILEINVFDAGVLRNRTPDEFAHVLVGKRIGRALRVGKWLKVEVDDVTILFHFGMTGSLSIGGKTALHRHHRVVFVTDAGEIRFRDLRKLRGIYLAADAGEAGQITGVLGVDALRVSAETLRDRLEPCRSSIKTALVDQSRVSGIGNFLSDEILWRAGIDPRTLPATLTDLQWARLHESLRTVVRAVARAGHTPRSTRWLTGARRESPATCPTCGRALERGAVGGRSSVWCAGCQRAG